MATDVLDTTAPAAGVLLRGVGWDFYDRFLREIDEKNHVRHTYDEGVLELMSALGPLHENCKRRITRMIDVLTEELEVPMTSIGSTTLRRELLSKGVEPDDCFYLGQNVDLWNKQQLDLDVQPAPDLAIEVDVTSSSLDRMAVYAALGVREVWRYAGAELTVHVLKGNRYRKSKRSQFFPQFPAEELDQSLDQARFESDETRWIRDFRQWVRKQLSSKRKS